MKKALLASTLVAALAFSATAAGSTPAQYRTQVNAICAKGVKQLDAIPKPAKPSEYYAYFKKGVELGDKLLAKVAAVKPPSSLKAVVADALAKQGALEKALRSLADKLKTSSDPQKTVQNAQAKLTKLNDKANKAWLVVKLPKCVG